MPASSNNTLVCSVELSKTAGMTLKVLNSAGKITQTVVINGTTLVMTVKGEKSTTTVTRRSTAWC